MPAYRPIDHALTDPIPPPATPSLHCHWHGQPAVCALDGLISILDWQSKFQQANADRATARRVSAGAQP